MQENAMFNGYEKMRKNLTASLIVFLVALPLCLGIAVASGVSPEKGIVSGFIGGVIVGLLGGSPLQVSGPANSLIVIVADAAGQIGFVGLSVAIVIAGMMQVVAGFMRGGRLVRLFPPALTHGLMTGFAVLIFASQTHVLLDGKPEASFWKNLQTLPDALGNIGYAMAQGQPSWGAIFGLAALLLLVLMAKFNEKMPAIIRKIPAALLVVIIFTALSVLAHPDLKRVHVPDNLVDDFALPDLKIWLASMNGLVFEFALVIFVLASSESLLSASAVDAMKPGHVSNYDRELMAQGAGNIVCGVVGALPVAGVIIRSTANIVAGAASRWSTILHGVWLLSMVGLFPYIIGDVPMSILGAILIFSVTRLINLNVIAELAKTDKWAWPMYIVSCLTVLLVNPMAGVGVGLGLQALRSLPSLQWLRPARGGYDARSTAEQVDELV